MRGRDDAIEAAHRAICEDSLDECLDWRGRCVKAVGAAAPHLMAAAWREGHADGRDYQGDGWNADRHDPEADNPYSVKP